MGYGSDRNSNFAAAALGGKAYNNVDDINTTTNTSLANSQNTTNTSNNTPTDSYNDNSSDDSVRVKDSLNGNSFDGSDRSTTVTDSNNDNSDNSVDVAVGINDSFKQISNTDNSLDNVGNTALSNVGNTYTADSGNTANSHNSSHTDVDTYSGNHGSFNTLDVGINDAFNFDDGDIVDLKGIQSNIEDLFTVGGNGNVVAIDQTFSIQDNDTLTATVNGPQNSSVGVGGCNDGGFGWAGGDGSVGAHASGGADASGDAVTSLSAFNQSISMGANIQYHSVNMNVIGNGGGASIDGDDNYS